MALREASSGGRGGRSLARRLRWTEEVSGDGGGGGMVGGVGSDGGVGAQQNSLYRFELVHRAIVRRPDVQYPILEEASPATLGGLAFCAVPSSASS